MKWTWRVHINSKDRADQRILKAIEQGYGEWKLPPAHEKPVCSRSYLQRLIEEGKVTANGQPIKANTKLREGEQIQIEFPPPRSLELIPEKRPIDVLFEDDHLLVINKAPGMTVHPSQTQMEGTLVHALLYHVKDLSGIGGVLRPGIVHRLDKDTSGAMVVTKTDIAHQKLTEIFSKHQIDRRYWALCYGSPEKIRGELRIESLIGRSPTDRKKMSMQVTKGRKAITVIKKLEEYAMEASKPFASLLEATLHTGRTHQVRVHLNGIGHSVLGDPAYGVPSSRSTKWLALPEEIRNAASALPGQALHARILGFTHPISGKPLVFEAEPPEGFCLLLKALQRYR